MKMGSCFVARTATDTTEEQVIGDLVPNPIPISETRIVVGDFVSPILNQIFWMASPDAAEEISQFFNCLHVQILVLV
jgi:hypothetical protein